MKKLILGLLVFGMSSCSEPKVESRAFDALLSSMLSGDVSTISPNEIPEASSYVFLDARAHEEFEISHIEGAVWVGFDDFSPERLPVLSASDTVIVYCSIGYRSEKIASKLLNTTDAVVFNLYGGIFEWANQGLPMVDLSAKRVAKVHAYSPEWAIWLKKEFRTYGNK
jgi:rhodanese-related sulfurtransferase